MKSQRLLLAAAILLGASARRARLNPIKCQVAGPMCVPWPSAPPASYTTEDPPPTPSTNDTTTNSTNLYMAVDCQQLFLVGDRDLVLIPLLMLPCEDCAVNYFSDCHDVDGRGRDWTCPLTNRTKTSADIVYTSDGRHSYFTCADPDQEAALRTLEEGSAIGADKEPRSPRVGDEELPAKVEARQADSDVPCPDPLCGNWRSRSQIATRQAGPPFLFPDPVEPPSPRQTSRRGRSRSHKTRSEAVQPIPT